MPPRLPATPANEKGQTSKAFWSLLICVTYTGVSDTLISVFQNVPAPVLSYACAGCTIGCGRTTIAEIDTDYAYVTNLSGFTGGAQKETNAELYTRLLSSVTNETIASPDGISKLLKRNYPSIELVVVKGMTDDEMIRDLAFEATVSGLLNWNSAEYYESDVYGCVSGYHDYPYNQSVAYYGLFQDDTTTSGYDPQDLPEVAEGFQFPFPETVVPP